MYEEEEEDLHDHYYDHIVRRCSIPKRTNWRHPVNYSMISQSLFFIYLCPIPFYKTDDDDD